MNHKQILSSLALCGILLAGVSSPAAADCKRLRITASGLPVHFLDKEAKKEEKNAIAAWEYLAAKQAGKAYANWKYAQHKKIECWLPNRSFTQCKATAVPCDGK